MAIIQFITLLTNTERERERKREKEREINIVFDALRVIAKVYRYYTIYRNKKKIVRVLFEIYNLFYSILIKMVNNNEDLSNNVIER